MDNRAYEHTEERPNSRIPAGGIRIPLPDIQPPRRGHYASLYDEQNYNRPASIADPERGGLRRTDLGDFDEIPLDDFSSNDIYPTNGDLRSGGRPFSYETTAPVSSGPPSRHPHKPAASPLVPVYKSIPAREAITPSSLDHFPIANHQAPPGEDGQGSVSTVYSHTHRKKKQSLGMICLKICLVLLGLLLAAVVAVGLYFVVECGVNDKCHHERKAVQQHYDAMVLDANLPWSEDLTNSSSEYYSDVVNNFTATFAELDNDLRDMTIHLGQFSMKENTLANFIGNGSSVDLGLESDLVEFDFDFSTDSTLVYDFSVWSNKIVKAFQLPNSSYARVEKYTPQSTTNNPTTSTSRGVAVNSSTMLTTPTKKAMVTPTVTSKDMTTTKKGKVTPRPTGAINDLTTSAS